MGNITINRGIPCIMGNVTINRIYVNITAPEAPVLGHIVTEPREVAAVELISSQVVHVCREVR